MCGKIRYQLRTTPDIIYYCHCNDCKKSTGSAFHVGLVLEAADVDVLSGQPKGYTKTADSGNQMTRLFCDHCGSPLFTKDSGAPDNLVVKAGSLDNADHIKPIAELWTIHKSAWATINPDITSLEKGKAFELRSFSEK